MATWRIGLREIEHAAARLHGLVRHTPLAAFDETLHLKLESLQLTGSFKVRGALHAVAEGSPRAEGVSCVSAGNHGLALAYAAKRHGMPARVYVPPHAVPRKVDAIRRMGADVVAAPFERLAAMLAASDAGDGTRFVPPFGDPLVAAGNGTVGREVARALPDVATVLVPVGGGGLALGVGTAMRALAPRAKVLGVSAEGSPAVRLAFEEGRREPVRPTSIADGLGAPIADLAVVEGLRHVLDGLLMVDDAEIRRAMRRLALEAGVVAEPAGAAAFAAATRDPTLARPAVVVVSGANVDPGLLAAVLAEGA